MEANQTAYGKDFDHWYTNNKIIYSSPGFGTNWLEFELRSLCGVPLLMGYEK